MAVEQGGVVPGTAVTDVHLVNPGAFELQARGFAHIDRCAITGSGMDAGSEVGVHELLGNLWSHLTTFTRQARSDRGEIDLASQPLDGSRDHARDQASPTGVHSCHPSTRPSCDQDRNAVGGVDHQQSAVPLGHEPVGLLLRVGWNLANLEHTPTVDLFDARRVSSGVATGTFTQRGQAAIVQGPNAPLGGRADTGREQMRHAEAIQSGRPEADSTAAGLDSAQHGWSG